MASTCWPWFSAKYRALAAEPWTKTILKASAVAGADGDIPVKPEELRARAEAQLAQSAPQALVMIGGRLSLETYTYARYMASEALGNQSTVEERVAVGEALRNQSKRSGRSIYRLLTPSGFYGPIHAPDAYCESIGKDCTGKHNVCCAPFKRWAATTRDPSVMTVLLASLVTSNLTDFANGADDQAAVHTADWVKYLANKGKYWVGPLPGVDHYNTFLVWTPDPLTRQAAGQQLLERGLTVLGQKPVWPPMTEVCSTGPGLAPSKGGDVLLALLGLAVGVVGGIYFNRWLAGGVALGEITAARYIEDESLPVSERLKTVRVTAKQKANEILMDRIATRSYWSERDDAAYDRMTERERTQVNDQLEKQANRLAKLLGYSQAWSS